MGCESGSDREIRWGPLALYFLGDRFSGWDVSDFRAAVPDMALANGIHVGSTAKELRAAYPDLEVMETTFGTEWHTASGAMGGHLDDERAKVIAIRDGQYCVFR